jgi:phosphoglycolate phosphatase-like HAD superfamily hydrolase
VVPAATPTGPRPRPRPEPRLLLLFDIDGTLLQRAAIEHGRALREAAAGVHGIPPLDGLRVEFAGRTDAAIVRDLLVLAGVAGDEADARWPEVMDAAVAAYESLCPADLSKAVAPGVPELLAALAERPETFRLSLVTGNLQPIARRKLANAGIGGYFEAGQGGFGSDHLDRDELPPIARARAGDWPRERTVVVGDTPRDIACARSDSLRVAAVATGPFAIEALADADAVVDDARALLPVLSDWV